MDNYFLVYLWTKLHIFDYLFYTFAVVNTGIIGMYVFNTKEKMDIYFSTTSISKENCNEIAIKFNKELFNGFKNNKYMRSCIFILIFSGILALSLPNKKDAVLIYLLPKISNSSSIEEWNKVIDTMPKAIQGFLEEYTPKK